MPMKRYIFPLIAVVIFSIAACKNEKDTYFLIRSDQVGMISSTSTLEEVEQAYQADSIVKDTTELSIGVGNDKLRIYERGGKHLLTLTPNKDSIPGVEHILVADPRFATEEGVNLYSTFGDLKKNYQIKKIITSFNNIVILLEDSNVYFTIDKKELPSHLKYTTTRPIEEVEIPEEAKFKYLMVGWD